MAWRPDYVTSAALKSYLRIDPEDTEDDTFIPLWITTVSRNVDDFCGRQFGQVAAPEQRTYTGRWDRTLCRYVAVIDDLQDVAGLAVADGDGNAITDYDLEPVNAQMTGKPLERIVTDVSGRLLVTGKWGWTAQPGAVSIGMFLQAARLAARRDSPFGISGSPQEQGEIQLWARLDPDFQTSLKPLRRKWWAA